MQQKHGIIEDGRLVLTRESYPGAKPVTYAPAPEYDQLTQQVAQLPPVDRGEDIFVDCEVVDLPPQDDETGDELF